MKVKIVNKRKFISKIILLMVIVMIALFYVSNKSKSESKRNNNSIETFEKSSQEKKDEAENDNEINSNEQNKFINPKITEDTKISTTRGLPVLMYHFFYDKEKESGKDNNFIEVTDFENQMKYLSDEKYYFPSWQEVEDFIDGKLGLPEKSVVITIDDGDETFLDYAIPIIKKYNVKVTSFVVTSWNGDWVPSTYKSSHLDFQSHSHDMHRAGKNGKGRFINLNYEDGVADVTKSKEIIGENCNIFCYPFGHFNDTSIKVLKDSGYRLAFTTKGGRVKQGANKYELPRIRISKGISMTAFKDAVK